MSQHYLAAYAALGIQTKQGRLGPPVDGHFQSFPRTEWEQELEMLAGLTSVRGIEWMFDAYGEGANPLESADSRQHMTSCLAAAGLELNSVCADYFMDYPLLRCSAAQRRERCEKLAWLIDVSAEVGIRRIVLPLLDASRIKTDAELTTIIECLHQVLPVAQQRSVYLSLETDFAPGDLRNLLLNVDHPMVKVNYDTGNSAAAGFDPREEFAAYGAWIGSVHVKDRLRGAGSVALGTGDVDFPLLRDLLLEIDYRGDFVMEAARGEPGREPVWQERMAERVVNWLRGAPMIPEEMA